MKSVTIPMLLGSLALAPFAPAQSPAPAAPDPNTPIELSPFVVQDQTDQGYAATETLAGTRLRTDARDVASAMTIVTPDLIHDLGALDFNDLADFLPSTASYANNDGDQFNNGSRTGTPVIVRGYRSDSLSTDFFTDQTPIDTYNTARLTFSRGPNSILFGVGNPGGLIDTVSNKGDLNRNFGRLDLRVDSFDSFRSAVDANVAAVPGKFGLRVDLLHDDRGRNIKPSQSRRDSLYLAAAIRPTPSTMIQVNAEANRIRQQIPRPYETFDWYTPWLNAGSPVVATAKKRTPVHGVEFLATNGYPVFVPGVGAMDWSSMAYGERPLVNGVRQTQMSFGVGSPARPVPLDTYVMGDGDHVRLDSRNLSLVIQQRLAPGLNLEIGGKHEYAYRENQESQGTGADNTIKVDTNAQLPNGAPNPNVGRPYVELSGNITKIPTTDDQFRVTLAYEKDLSGIKLFNRGLGRITLAGLYNNEAVHQYLDNYRLVNETPVSVSTKDLSNARNLIHYRSYLNADNTYFTTPLTAFTGQNGVQAGWEPVNTPRNNFTRTKSYALAGQAVLLDHLVALTGGVRRDDALVGQYNYTKDARGLYTDGGSHGGTPAPEINSTGRPYLYGVVVNPLPSFSLYFNRSTNFQPVNQSFRLIDDQPLPAVRGRGIDTGVKFYLLNQKLIGSFDYFETQQTNVRDSTVNSANMVNWINAIWDAVDSSRKPATGWTDVKQTKTHGIEFQLVANPTKNLRLMFNASRDINLLEDHGATTYAYLAANLPAWQSHASLPTASPDASTVGGLIALIQQEESDQQRVIGTKLTRVYEWQANFVGRYAFDRNTPLNGFAVGSAARWRNAPVIGFARNGTLLDITRPFDGRDSFNLDAWVEYGRRFTVHRHPLRWSVELRVQNVLDDRTLLPWTAIDDGTGRAFVLQRRTPGERAYILSSSVEF